MIETTVLAMPVIVVKPTQQVLLSLGRVGFYPATADGFVKRRF